MIIHMMCADASHAYEQQVAETSATKPGDWRGSKLIHSKRMLFIVGAY